MAFLTRDHLKLEVLMDLNVLGGAGRGAVQFEPMASHEWLTGHPACIALTTLMFARTLVNHAETREQLRERVFRAATALMMGTSERADFGEWTLSAGGMHFPLWPWEIVQSAAFRDAKSYIARLQTSKLNGTPGIHLKMAWGQERVLAPVSALLPIHVLSRMLGPQGKKVLGYCLVTVSTYYAENAAALGSEVRALMTVVPAIGAYARDGEKETAAPSPGAVALEPIGPAISRDGLERIFQLSRREWNARADRLVAFPAGWQVRASTGSDGEVSLMALSPGRDQGRLVQPIYSDSGSDASPEIVHLMRSYAEVPNALSFDDFCGQLEAATAAEVGPGFTVNARPTEDAGDFHRYTVNLLIGRAVEQ
jgi:hypothetical protein